MEHKKSKRLRVVSFVVSAYMLIALVWWSYLLYVKNNDAYLAKVELLKITQIAQGEVKDLASFKQSPAFVQLTQQYGSQEKMIMSEAAVLAITLMVGIWFINRGYQRQVEATSQSRNFLLSITHELKSPLASIRLILQTFSKRELPYHQIKKFSQNALQETDRLESLVNNLLLAARLENTKMDIQKEEIELYPLLDGIRENILHKNPEANISLDIQEDTLIYADKKGMMSILVNLMENATKYSDKPAQIMVSHEQNPHKNIITIADLGWGIPNNVKNKIFQKFYRVGNEDTRKAKGTGLGLYIVKEIVESHGGKITVKNNEPKGTIFRIEMSV